MTALEQHDVERWLARVCERTSLPKARLRFAAAGQDLRAEAGHEALKGPRLPQLFQPDAEPEVSPIAWQTDIRCGAAVLGTVQVQLEGSNQLTREFLQACQLAEQISQMASDYISLLESFRQLQSRTEREWTGDVMGQGAVSAIVEETLKSLVRLTSYRGVAFFLLDASGTGLQLKQYLHQSLQPIRASQRNLLEADFDRQALLQGHAVCRRREHRDAQWLPEDVQTGVCVRVANAEGMLGTLWVYDRRVRSVEDRDLHVVQSIAVQLGVLLDRAVSTHHSLHHRRLKTELRLASITQPAKSLTYTSPGEELQAYGKCLSQFDLGGDLCEIIPLQDQAVLMLVGDASGNSIPAAMVMTAVRGCARSV